MNILTTPELYKPKSMQSTVLSIAGSDPTGGAGIQADLKTMTSIGVYGAAVVTCVTVQNSNGVSRVECLPSELVIQQVKAVLEDHNATHVKIGMVGTASTADAVSNILEKFSGEIVYDPVMISSTGQSLLDNTSDAASLKNLLSACSVLTPNLPELEKLTGETITTMNDAVDAAGVILSGLPNLRAVIVKGGHLGPTPETEDVMVCRSLDTVEVHRAPHPFINTVNTHGTGCTLATAFSSYHCLTGNMKVAFYRSIHYVQKLLEQSAVAQVVRNSKGHGPLLHYKVKPDPDSGMDD